MTASTPRRGVRIALAAVATALVASFGFAAPSMAATPDPARASSSSLTIHKYEGAPGAEHDGTQIAEPGLPGLNDVTFSVQRIAVDGVTIDLGTNAGQALAQELFAEVGSNPTLDELNAAGVTFVTTAAQTTAGGTDTTGATAVFSGLGFGLYYVTETAFPAGTTPAAPFLVSVPLTNPANNTSWLYDVHVYPKNSVSAVEKEVDDAADIKLGDEVTFTIRGDIPDLPANTPIDGYKIVDQLDPKLNFVSATVTLDNGTAIDPSFYTVTPAGATPNGPLVSVVFNDLGRAFLSANSAEKVRVVITTTVNTVGVIENTVLLYPNLPSFDIEPGEPGGPNEPEEPVVTKWGGITLVKTDATDGSVLEDAQFQVYASTSNTFASASVVTVPGAPTVGGITGSVWTTQANGEVVIEGLRYSNWANNAAVAPGDTGYMYYWLVEITAPDNYELLPEPIAFAVTSQSADFDVAVENVPSNSGFELPLTGGVGTTVLYLAGGLIVAGALFLAIRSRRAKA